MFLYYCMKIKIKRFDTYQVLNALILFTAENYNKSISLNQRMLHKMKIFKDFELSEIQINNILKCTKRRGIIPRHAPF